MAQRREGLILPGPKAADARQAAGKETGLGGGRSRGAVPPTSTSKGIALGTGRELALLLFLSQPSCSLNKSLNPTRYRFERKVS